MANPDDPNAPFAAPGLPEEWSGPPAGRVLCFAPHPDDEVIGPGGALYLHRQQGDTVRVVIATDGISGDPDGLFPTGDYAMRRRSESERGLACLGVTDFEFWGFPDSAEVTDDDVGSVAALALAELERVRPEVVYLPWEGETNSDHLALHCGVVRALHRFGFRGSAWGYEVWTPMVPDALLDITEIEAIKRRAIGCYESQLRYVDYTRPIFGLHAHRSLQFQRGMGYCEAYRRIVVSR